MTKVKICGVTTLDDALMVANAGADMIGLNFHKASPRYISMETAREICSGLKQQFGDRCPAIVGVFVNATDSDITNVKLKAGLDYIQLSGDESDRMIAELRGIAFKAIRPMNKAMALEDVNYFRAQFPTNDRIPSILLDAYHPKLYGGTGESTSVDVALAVKEIVPRMMLAGGLTPENVAERIASIQPWGVDVASGVESGQPGVKDADKVKAFIEAARQVGG